MIANPTVPAFRFDPYSKKFTRETYEHSEMRSVRADAVRAARRNLVEQGSASWAVLLGTLGRQGSVSVMQTVAGGLTDTPLLVLLSELSPQKLALFPSELISTFVQTSCPRLSIDWGYAFSRPLLSPYEASVASGRVQGWDGMDIGERRGAGDYPMDFYAVSRTYVLSDPRTEASARGPRGTSRRNPASCRIVHVITSILPLLSKDGAHKRVVVDLAVLHGEALEEFVDLLVGHLLAELGEDVAELAGADKAVAGLVKHLEALDKLVGGAGRLPPVGAVEDLEKLVVVD
jgi:2-(3-amino-3-carboxypropyl)histidine synthase